MPTAAEKKAAIDLLVEEGVIERTDDGEIQTEAQTDKAMAIDNWINDLGGFDDAAIMVYQVDPSSNKMEYVESMGVQEMTGPMLFEKLKNEYGGGKFRIQMRADGAIRKTQTVLIKKVPIKEKDPAGVGVDLPSLVRELKVGQNNSGGIESILQMMQAQTAQFQQMFLTLVEGMNKSSAPVFDPMAMQAGMLEGIEKMQKLAGLNKPEKSATDMILEGVKLVGAIKESGEGGEANVYSLLSKAFDGFSGTLGQAMAMAPSVPNAPPIPGQLPQPALTALADQRPPDENKSEPVLGQPTLPQGHPLAPFEPFVDWMLALANKNANPELYAEVIIDQIGAETAHAWLATEEGINALKENLPKTVPFEKWLRLVGQEIALIIEDNRESAELDSEPGVDVPGRSADNAPEGSPRTSDVRTGHDSPIESNTNQPSDDGDTERPGGDSGDAAIDGEIIESSENDAADS